MREFLVFCDTFVDRIDEIMKEHLLRYYAEEIHPKHFSFFNVTEYGYSPLSGGYERRKIKKYGVQPILVASGKLARSSYKITNGVLIYRTPIYARYVKEKRDFFRLSNKDKKALLRAMRRFLINQYKYRRRK